MSRKRGQQNSDRVGTAKRHKSNNKNEKASDENIPDNNNIEEDDDATSKKCINRTGKILRMRLQNFMCHSNLVIDFNKRANFLVGGNGSGKSAVLTALVIGLGSRANVTNRGTALRSLIKNGEGSATIEIEISNEGPFDYKTDLLGNKITVSRNITATGTSTYKISNERGKVIYKGSEASKELQAFLYAHNIQPCNTVFILNQDTARSFLKDSDPTKNYELFTKASQIDIIRRNMHECAHMFVNHKRQIDCTQKRVILLEAEEANLQDKFDRLKSVEEMKVMQKKYEIEKLWLNVTSQEEKNTKLLKEITELREKIEDINGILKDESALCSIQNKIQSLENELGSKNQILLAENETLSTLNRDRKDLEERQQIQSRKTRKLEEKIKELKEQIQILDVEINKRSEITSSRVMKMREVNENKIQNLKRQITELDDMIQNARRDLESHRETRNHFEEQFEDLKRKRRQLSDTNTRIQAELNRIKSSPKENINIYGEHMERLLASIDRAHASGKFSTKPIGPIGRYIEVPDKKWRTMVENLLLGVLQAFLVNSTQDRLALDEIIRREFPGVKLTIITLRFHDRVYDVRNGAVAEVPGSHLLMNKIKCPNPVVMNCLIDNISIETTLLVESQDLAVSLTANDETVPRNLSKVILLQPALQYLPSPGYRIYPQHVQSPRFLQINNEQRKIQLENELRENEEQKNEYESEMVEVRNRIQSSFKYEKEKSDIIDQHRRTLAINSSEIKELQDTEFPTEDDLNILMNELEEMKSSLTSTLEQKEECVELLNKCKEKLNLKLVTIREQDTLVRGIEREMAEVKDKLEALTTKQNYNERNKTRYMQKRKEYDKQLGNLESQLEEETQKLQNLIARAETEGDRVESRYTLEELEKQIKKLERRISSTCAMNEDINEVETQLMSKTSEIKDLGDKANTIQELLLKLKESQFRNFRSVKFFKEHMNIRMKFSFDKILKIHKYVGKISVDYESSTLTISVVPRDHHLNNAVSNTKQLSGGERSFITTAFLLALWSCIDHPFYFLDEYDVFTDQVNREIITKLLLKEAISMPQRQYVFLTPQDMSFLEGSDSIKIHKFEERKN